MLQTTNRKFSEKIQRNSTYDEKAKDIHISSVQAVRSNFLITYVGYVKLSTHSTTLILLKAEQLVFRLDRIKKTAISYNCDCLSIFLGKSSIFFF